MKAFFERILKGLHKAWDENRIWAVIWATVAVAMVIIGNPLDCIIGVAGIAVLLFTGSKISEKVPLGLGIGSMGFILDMITDKLNNPSYLRTLGHLFMITELVYILFAELGLLPMAIDRIGILGGIGVTMFASAIARDEIKAKQEGSK
jgi:hypothetical protein